MRYGLLADIHEDTAFLAAALDRFAVEGVDRVIVLGDVFRSGGGLEATTALLRSANAIGVWGNHDFGLSHDPHDDIRARFSPECMEFMASLRPILEFEDCLVTHVEPYRDHSDIFDLWSFGEPDSPAKSFAARPHRLMLHGHHHRWVVHDPGGPVDWDRIQPLRLDPANRYLIQVGAVCDGRCGILDTSANVIVPFDLRDGD